MKILIKKRKTLNGKEKTRYLSINQLLVDRISLESYLIIVICELYIHIDRELQTDKQGKNLTE